MINMENREEILKKHTELNKIQLTNPHYTVGGIKNGIKTSGTFVLFEDVPHAMQEYSDQQNKQLLDEIELVNTMNVKLNNNNIKLLNEIDMLKELNATLQFHNIKYQSKIDQLQFELKAADSVNEGLSKANEEIIELLEGNGVTNTNWILNRLKELTNQNK